VSLICVTCLVVDPHEDLVEYDLESEVVVFLGYREESLMLLEHLVHDFHEELE
jgi:hypothetical protein